MPGPSAPRHLDTKTLDRIQRMDVRARLVVEGFLTGQHQSPYNGFAVEFATHREYAPGDDVRHIDWKVWSKTDRLYIKEYEEETNLKCHIFLDSSKSMKYGEVYGWSKFDHAATAAASLAYLLQQQQDIVGLHLFSNTCKPRSLTFSSSWRAKCVNVASSPSFPTYSYQKKTSVKRSKDFDIEVTRWGSSRACTKTNSRFRLKETPCSRVWKNKSNCSLTHDLYANRIWNPSTDFWTGHAATVLHWP